MIRYHKQPEKYILSQDRITAERLLRAIGKLPSGDTKPLSGSNNPKLYRLRVGDYRVVFYHSESDTIITRIDTRGDVYKDN